ncbi:hypothetical protein MDAP_000986 [Mitosporidium daphniae]|uniref:Uncharacterized protein n=1 Tax=Mitosporidium daphniae TaxID=1485682 RepID=A0A098VNQ0_9MICR|nr:uncharacterized protein DI09_72p30 [Mitosporidium daphniae]KGG50384.1 hypothetical protein DI09_72p30 [Mitosporidium daphniae]|eukprot:XP_013236827.1 uncharacterized protein DI09_72p30 [Mitosporidium daphniae]
MFHDCVCLVFKEPLDHFPESLLNYRFSSGFLFGSFPANVDLLDANSHSPKDIIYILENNRAARRMSAPAYIPDKLIPGSGLFMLMNTSNNLLNFLEELRHNNMFVYIVAKLSVPDKERWKERQLARENCSSVLGKKISLPVVNIIEDSDDIYIVLLLIRPGYSRCDRITRPDDVIANALESGTLASSSLDSFIFKDLPFKMGIAEKFGS